MSITNAKKLFASILSIISIMMIGFMSCPSQVFAAKASKQYNNSDTTETVKGTFDRDVYTFLLPAGWRIDATGWGDDTTIISSKSSAMMMSVYPYADTTLDQAAKKEFNTSWNNPRGTKANLQKSQGDSWSYTVKEKDGKQWTVFLFYQNPFLKKVCYSGKDSRINDVVSSFKLIIPPIINHSMESVRAGLPGTYMNKTNGATLTVKSAGSEFHVDVKTKVKECNVASKAKLEQWKTKTAYSFELEDLEWSGFVAKIGEIQISIPQVSRGCQSVADGTYVKR